MGAAPARGLLKALDDDLGPAAGNLRALSDGLWGRTSFVANNSGTAEERQRKGLSKGRRGLHCLRRPWIST